MDPRTLIEALAVAGRLKDVTRHCDTARGRRESVAEHSWRLTLLAYFVSDEFPEADLTKLLKMCLIHDMGEAFTGDIPSFEKTRRQRGARRRAAGRLGRLAARALPRRNAGAVRRDERP